jgi:hypothetical protein
MGTTTFTGPIKAGTIRDTTGTTVGSNVANVGSVVMAQSAVINEAASGTATDIVIPAGSQVINCTIFPTTVFAGNITLGTSSTGQGFASATAPADNSRTVFAPVDNALWKDVGTSDVRIYHDGASAGGGVGVLTVEYIQNNNLS